MGQRQACHWQWGDGFGGIGRRIKIISKRPPTVPFMQTGMIADGAPGPRSRRFQS